MMFDMCKYGAIAYDFQGVSSVSHILMCSIKLGKK